MIEFLNSYIRTNEVKLDNLILMHGLRIDLGNALSYISLLIGNTESKVTIISIKTFLFESGAY